MRSSSAASALDAAITARTFRRETITAPAELIGSTFSGHARDVDHPFPALYPQANSPQAWSASAVFCFVQSLLGLYPYAPLVDPRLPDWPPEIALDNLRVSDAIVSLHFFLKADGSSDYRVAEQQGRLHVVRQPSPWSLTASPTERLVDAV